MPEEMVQILPGVVVAKSQEAATRAFFSAMHNETVVRQQYGYLAGFLDHPEIGPLLRRAASEGWDQARLQGAVSGTNWWKTTGETARNWELLKSTDPAEAERQRSARYTDIAGFTSQQGINLSGDRLDQLIEDSIRMGWSQAELQLHLGSELTFTPGGGEGAAGNLYDTNRAKANDFLVPLSDEAVFDWTKRITQGVATQEGFDAYLRDMAKGRMASLAPYLDQGMSPAQVLEPLKQQVAQILEVSPGQINLADEKWWPVVSTVDPKTNQLRPMTMNETAQFARSLPEWSKTRNAQERGAGLSEALLQTFGKVA